MGYKHIYKRTQELDLAKFKLAVDDCKKVCDTLSIPLAGAEGTREPEFSDRQILFNGSVDSHSFCKTDTFVPWPSDDADGIAIVGEETTQAGSWFGGKFLTTRCVDEDGDGSYEAFIIDQKYEPDKFDICKEGKYYVSCKTAFRPYDLNVQCCLIVFKHYFGDDFIVYSNGTDKQWNEARDVCQHILKYGLNFELDDKD